MKISQVDPPAMNGEEEAIACYVAEGSNRYWVALRPRARSRGAISVWRGLLITGIGGRTIIPTSRPVRLLQCVTRKADILAVVERDLRQRT